MIYIVLIYHLSTIPMQHEIYGMYCIYIIVYYTCTYKSTSIAIYLYIIMIGIKFYNINTKWPIYTFIDTKSILSHLGTFDNISICYIMPYVYRR